MDSRSMTTSGVDWIGEIPEGWGVLRLKSVLSKNTGGAWGEDPDGKTDVVVLRSTEQTYLGEWDIKEPAFRKLTASDYEKTRLEEGDILITKSSGSETHIGKATLVKKGFGSGCGYSNFMQRIRTNSLAHPSYVWRVLSCDLARNQFNYLSTTTTGLSNLNAEIIQSIFVAVPPLPEQQSIAAFLDHHTSLIDRERSLIDQKIELLREKRKALIFECVTGKRMVVQRNALGKLNDQVDVVGTGSLVAIPTPELPDGFMVNSGVEWIGKIPKGWEISRLKDKFKLINKKNSGDTVYVGMEAIESSTGKRFSEVDTRTSENGSDSSFEDGDILFGKLRPYLRKVWLANVSGSCSTEFFVLRGRKDINRNYFSFLLLSESFCLEVNDRCGGVKMPRADWDDVGGMLVPVPSGLDQENISLFLMKSTNSIDKEISLLIKKNELLAEKRKALIFEAVTGKIDCRSWNN